MPIANGVDASVSPSQVHPLSVNADGEIDANLASPLPAGTNNIGDVDVLTLPAIPAGTNNIGDVDVLTLPALPAGTNNIGDVDVLSLPVLPAGDNNIGNVDVVTLPSIPAGGNNIGDVDVLTLPSIPAGGNNIGDVDVLTMPITQVKGSNNNHLFSYEDMIGLSYSNLNLAAGNNTLDIGTVPANKIWEIQNVAIMYSGTITNVAFMIMAYSPGAVAYTVYHTTPVVNGIYKTWQGHLILKASWKLRVMIFSATLNDDVYVQATGYQMDIS